MTDNLKLIDQATWNSFAANLNVPIPVGALLHQAGYSSNLENLHINANYWPMDYADFSGVNFKQCQFTGAFSHLKFGAGTMFNTEVKHAYFSDTTFGAGMNFSQTNFSDTFFKNTTFDQNKFEEMHFSYTNFDNSIIKDSAFESVFISHSNLVGLLGLNLSQEIGKGIKLLDTDAPVIGLISSPYELIYGGEIGLTADYPYASLKQYGATTVLLDMASVRFKIDQTGLKKEIKSILASAPEGLDNIPQYLLAQQADNLDKIKVMAKDYAQHLDAAWIPGGPDIHPEFYGQLNTASYTHDNHYVREIFEFALINEMVLHNKPLMGICHGSQITNVYFGGTLKQHVEGHYENHLVIPIEMNMDIAMPTGVVSEILLKPTIGASNHHQAIDKLGNGLKAVAISGSECESESGSVIENFIIEPLIETVIEAAEGINGKPIMLFQFHPEYALDQTNRDIVQQFVHLAKQYHETHDAMPHYFM